MDRRPGPGDGGLRLLEAAAYTTGITPEQHCSFVLGNADGIRRALDAITAPYETPRAATHPSAPSPAA